MDNDKNKNINEINLEFAQKFNAATLDAFENLRSLKSMRSITGEQIQQFMNNPYSNADKLQDTMKYMININGILKEIIQYKSSMLTLDHYLICNDISKYKDKSKFDNAYRKAVLELRKYNIRFNVPWMLEKLIKEGELYLYKLQGDDGITLIYLPPKYCKITSSKGSVQHYSVNISALTDNVVNALPEEVQKLYKKYKDGNLKKDKSYKDGWYPLDRKNAFAFSLEYLVPKNIPYYTPLLRNLCRLCDMEDLDESTAELSNFKLIQMVIPTNPETGEILGDGDVAQMYFDDAKDELPSGIGFVGMPYKLNSIGLGDSNSKEIDYTNKLKKSTYDSAGINSEMFNGDRSNNQSVIYSQITDSLLAFKLLEQFRCFMNEDFKNNSLLKNFELFFIKSTQYDYKEVQKQMLSNIATYNGRLRYLASLGIDPHEAYNTIKQEELMGLDELMKPMLTSHTATSSKLDNGRPKVVDDDSMGDVGEAQN